jgi:transcriptional regulator with XRE-family HTH domain
MNGCCAGGRAVVGKRVCRGCGAILSRYNPDAVCARCVKNRVSVSERVPSWLWDSPALRNALAELDLGGALFIIRKAAGLSQLELAAMLGWASSTVGRVETGELETLCNIKKLLTVTDALDVPRVALTPILLGVPDAGQTGEEASDMSVSRRQLAGLAAGLTAAAGLSHIQIPKTVYAVHVHYLGAALETLRAEDQRVGGGGLREGGLRLYHRVSRMLDESDYTEEVGYQLAGVAGEIAGFVGWLHFDSDDQATAWFLYSEARQLADRAGDDQLAVRVMQQMANQRVHLARTGQKPALARQAIQLCRRAVDLARSDPHPELHALLAEREAVACAVLGDARGFAGATARAWREMDRAQPNELPSWLGFVTPAEITSAEAFGKWNLGNPADAVELFRTNLLADKSPRNRAMGHASLAAALLDTGDLTGAFTEGMAVLPLLGAGKIDSPRAVAKLQVVRRAAGRHRGGADFGAAYDQLAAPGIA